MPRIVKTIEINAAPEHVFALAADVSRQPEWTTFIREVSITSGDGKSEGTTDRMVFKVGPRARSSEGVWTGYKVGEIFARKSTSGMPLEYSINFKNAERGTLVEWVVEYRPPLGLLGAFMDVFMMNRIFQNEIEGSLERLKAALET